MINLNSFINLTTVTAGSDYLPSAEPPGGAAEAAAVPPPADIIIDLFN